MKIFWNLQTVIIINTAFGSFVTKIFDLSQIFVIRHQVGGSKHFSNFINSKDGGFLFTVNLKTVYIISIFNRKITFQSL